MNKKVLSFLEDLIVRYPKLAVCKASILDAYFVLVNCYSEGHKLLIGGNGGSCADSDHIVGELMKGFKNQRKCPNDISKKLMEVDSSLGKVLSEKLQCALPAISLSNHQSLNTAFINDVCDGGLYFFAQQLFGYGRKGDVFLGISTSGNSKNIYNACLVAKAIGMKIIGLTGFKGGLLEGISDVTIKVPFTETYIVQEYHLPIYHCLCLMLECTFFD